ncbi:hypothetical protein K469DRAFT_701981 [Zopfia rhizophila CBS 207.26]|uniref:Zn(2)-C6 fungal-type domain-containing protein n=1 Tax=Zopfia rhizophila CBS 207.26 TaxID=1314779 RepID=A0A6A6EBW3_9PEZI|nr:hypothetical protein K469DRAFT_701981 [Zopfia rhizophila CBS 207.26]
MSFTSSTSEWRSPLPLAQSPLQSTSKSTSAPAPKVAIPERKPKLRASCDACAASKVKCSKEHPSCARCTSNGTTCIYGLSRKHGKPGRVRKRNPDGTAKVPRQRSSPNSKEFNKFRVRAEPLLPDAETSNNTWTPAAEYDYQMSSNESYPSPTFSFMDDILNPQPTSPVDCRQTVEPELTFEDPFAKRESLQLHAPSPSDFQALKDFIGGGVVHPMDYSFNTVESFVPDQSEPPQSPMGSIGSNFNPLREGVAMPPSHCCYSLAHSTLESLHFPRSTSSSGSTPESTSTSDTSNTQSLDSVLSATKTAVQNILQLLSCPCSSDPHLAMLYSSIASKILTWYQIAAGLKTVTPPTPALTTASSPSLSSSRFSSSMSTPSASSAVGIKLQPLKIGAFEFDEQDQEALRRQVVLRELRKCGALVEALANWSTPEGEREHAEFLYDVLGAWLKSELFNTIRDVRGGEES